MTGDLSGAPSDALGMDRKIPLQRSGFLERSKPLGTPLPRRNPLKSVRTAREGRTVPQQPRKRPGPASKAEKAAKDVVTARAKGQCEMCGAPAQSWSHRVRKSQGGKWEAVNGVAACGTGDPAFGGCHGWLTGNPLLGNLGGWTLESWQEPAEWPVYLPRLGGSGWWFLTEDGGYREAPWAPAPAVVPWRHR